jgi:hypothetical protein
MAHAAAHSAARVLTVVPHLFFDHASGMLDMVGSIPFLGGGSSGSGGSSGAVFDIDAAITFCMVELTNLPKYICVNERGVAYRNTPDRFDRYEKVRGPESGSIMVALQVGGHNHGTNNHGTNNHGSISHGTSSHGTSSSNWIKVAVNETLEKWLPLMLSGEVLFERVGEEPNGGGVGGGVGRRLRDTLRELLEDYETVVPRRAGRVGEEEGEKEEEEEEEDEEDDDDDDQADDDDDDDDNDDDNEEENAPPRKEVVKSNIHILSVIQTHVIASVLGRDVASRRPALDLFLWYVQALLEKVNRHMKHREGATAGTAGSTGGSTGSNYLWLSIAAKELVPSVMVALRVVLKKGWIVKLNNISILLSNMSSLFTSLCLWNYRQQEQVEKEAETEGNEAEQEGNEAEQRATTTTTPTTPTTNPLTVLVANVSSEICNRILLQFSSVRTQPLRRLLQSNLFKGGLQVDLTDFTNTSSNTSSNTSYNNTSSNTSYGSGAVPLSSPSPLRLRSPLASSPSTSPSSSFSPSSPFQRTVASTTSTTSTSTTGTTTGNGRARTLRSPSDPLTPPRLRRMSSVVDEDHLLRKILPLTHPPPPPPPPRPSYFT